MRVTRGVENLGRDALTFEAKGDRECCTESVARAMEQVEVPDDLHYLAHVTTLVDWIGARRERS